MEKRKVIILEYKIIVFRAEIWRTTILFYELIFGIVVLVGS